MALFLASCAPPDAAEFGRAVELGNVSARNLDEISGVAASRRHPGVLWVHNDGARATLSAVSTNGQILARFRLQATVSDAEDIAIGPGPESGVSFLYLGDIGDNDAGREFIRVLRFPEPDLTRQPERGPSRLIERFETIVLKYPDKAHDAEALMIDPTTGGLFLATKQERVARVYAAASEQLADGATVTLTFAGEVSFGDVSAGDISPDGSQIILRRENAARLWRRGAGEGVIQALKRAGTATPVVGPPREPNGESIAFHPGGLGYYTISEGEGAAIYLFPRLLE